MVANRMLQAFLFATLLATGGLGGWILSGGEEATQASPALSIGVDADPSGNTATSLGAIDSCISVSNGTTFDVDIYVTDVTDLEGYELYISLDSSVVNVIDRNVKMFLSSEAEDYSAGVAYPGYHLAALDSGGYHSGSGVLARLTLSSVGSGATAVGLARLDYNGDGILDLGPRLEGPGDTYPGDVDGDHFFDGPISHAQIAVDRDCALDTDGDGWPDELDNCPNDANPSQTDTDEDSMGDMCDPDDDDDGVCDPGETDASCTGSDNCQWVPNPDQEDRHPNDIGDRCDDPDGDGFMDYIELYLPTDPDDDCPDVTGTPSLCPGPTCDGHDAWPYDNNVDTWSNVLDVLQYKGHLQCQESDPCYALRLDLNADEWVNVVDVLLYKGHLQVQCTNP